MISKIRNRQKGFTLIELLIVVAIIGIIAALLIPNFLDALQKAKQKRTVADMRNAGTAMFSWLTDQVGAAAAGAAATDVDLSKYTASDATTVASVLVPQYLQAVPEKDGWKKDFTYWLETTEVLKANVMAIASGGRDASPPASSYTVTGFDPTDYDQDIVWADGFFVRWPQKTN
jgi:prepilin-type N-terminal cleavage/methylation domain-containing protein